MKTLANLTLLFTCLILLSCGSSEESPQDDTSAGQSLATSDIQEKGEHAGEAEDEATTKDTGKESPDAVFDAIVEAAKNHDEEAYLALLSENCEIAQQFDAMVDLLKGANHHR
jgi:hypothetical protein